MSAPCRSRAALTYAEAQSRIDDERLQDEISVNLRRMNAIARVLRRQRTERGALQLASPEVKFEIDTETHDPLDVGMYQVRAPESCMVPLHRVPCAKTEVAARRLWRDSHLLLAQIEAPLACCNSLKILRSRS